MNHTFMPMESAPRDGRKVLLMMKDHEPVIATFEREEFEGESNDVIHYTGWCNDSGLNYESDSEFIGWFPIPISIVANNN